MAGDEVTMSKTRGTGIAYSPDSPDATFRVRLTGDQYPRIVLDPQTSTILIGDGTVPPTPILNVDGIIE